MKKTVFCFLLILGALAFSVNNLSAQIVVKVKPAKPKVVVVKPAKPGPRHVWVDGHWKWSAKKKEYVWVKGHWVKPKKGKKWVPGHWVKAPGGWKWVPGHWKRR